MAAKTQEESEKPAKVYQLDAINDEMTNIRKLLEDQNDMLKTTITLPYFEERLKGLKKDLTDQMAMMKQEYRPVLGNAKWVARTAIGAFVTLGLTLIAIYLKARG